jgi:citronellol/citronellal dehydrogenase
MKNIQPLEFKKVGDLKGKTVFITGASRGVGLAIALRAAKDGANVAIAAKTVTPNPKLEGTIYTAAEEIKKAGGNCLPISCDIRDEKSVKEALDLTAKTFGGIDILVNNASAISLSKVEETDTKRYDLFMSVNARGTFLCCKYAIPYLRKSKNPHILTVAPPLPSVLDVRFVL